MAFLATLTLVFIETFVRDALAVFHVIFRDRASVQISQTLDRLQQNVRHGNLSRFYHYFFYFSSNVAVQLVLKIS